jgi:hypothetical protein
MATEDTTESAINNVIFPAELAELKGVTPESIYYMCRKHWQKAGIARQDQASARPGWIIDREAAMRYNPSQKDSPACL